jgi:hypothetical protein
MKWKHLFLVFFSWFWIFTKNTWGIFQKPYSTYRKLVDEDPIQLLVLFSIIGIYFLGISHVKYGAFHPFVMTVNTGRLFTSTLGGYILICFAFVWVGRLWKKSVRLKSVMLGWGYSLVPTLLWFGITTVLYVLLPPPRQETVQGKFFSVLFVGFSIALLYWKGMLYYLALRFALNLDLKQISISSLVLLPIFAMYSVLLYAWGIFTVPFI